MKLHLIRHAKTEPFSTTGKDFDRALMERGKKQSLELSKFLETRDFKRTKVYCSAATRTRETLDLILNNFSSKAIVYEKDFYLCSAQAYLDWLWKQNHREDILLVGHNFGISDLANYLLDEKNEMRTCEYVCISFPFDSWKEISRATGSLSLHFRPTA